MARAVRNPKINTRSARTKLPEQREPYWTVISTGCALGYRRGKKGGTWVARFRDETGKQHYEALGAADDARDADGISVFDFGQAQAKARDWFDRKAREQAGGSVPPDHPYTVGDAIAAYLDFLKANRRTGADADKRAAALILPTLGGVILKDLTQKKLQQWLTDLAKSPPRLRTRAGNPQQYREIDPADKEVQRRRQSSANRVWTTFKAALNQAWREGHVEQDKVWRAVRPFSDVDAARVRYLDSGEARRFINACQGEFKTLVRAALHTGAAYGNLAALTVGDFSVHRVCKSDGGKDEQGSIHIVRYKGKGGRVRHVDVQLTDEAIAFFRSITAGRQASEPIFPRAGGDRWKKSQQARLMKKASEVANIDPPVSFHILRHTWASQAVMAGMPLFVVGANLGHADTRMVEKHYGHLAPSYIADQVQKFAPRFGVVDDNVVPIAAAR